MLPQILVDAAAGYGLPPSQSFFIFFFFFFYSGHLDVCTAIIIIIIIIIIILLLITCTFAYVYDQMRVTEIQEIHNKIHGYRQYKNIKMHKNKYRYIYIR